jgi:hypothetical protein
MTPSTVQVPSRVSVQKPVLHDLNPIAQVSGPSSSGACVMGNVILAVPLNARLCENFFYWQYLLTMPDGKN